MSDPFLPDPYRVPRSSPTCDTTTAWKDISATAAAEPDVLVKQLHDRIMEFERYRSRSQWPDLDSIIMTADELASIPRSKSTAGTRAGGFGHLLFGIPVTLMTPDIQSEIDVIQANRASCGLPPVERFAYAKIGGQLILYAMTD